MRTHSAARTRARGADNALSVLCFLPTSRHADSCGRIFRGFAFIAREDRRQIPRAASSCRRSLPASRRTSNSERQPAVLRRDMARYRRCRPPRRRWPPPGRARERDCRARTMCQNLSETLMIASLRRSCCLLPRGVAEADRSRAQSRVPARASPLPCGSIGYSGLRSLSRGRSSPRAARARRENRQGAKAPRPPRREIGVREIGVRVDFCSASPYDCIDAPPWPLLPP
jgi:hypothetical protein